MSRRIQGMTLTDLLVGVVIAVVLMGIFVPALTNVFQGANFLSKNTPLQAQTEDAVNTICSAIRDADPYGTTPVIVSTATATDIVLFTSTTGNTIEYYTSGGNLYLKYNGGSPTLLAANATMNLTYYQSTTQSYNVTALTAFSPTTTAQYAEIVAVGVTITVTNGNYTGSYSTMVRPRNSPAKTVPF